ncbi:MAG TPA: hypothetical protein VFT48_14400 [Pyrinomonadaceae bacterium]|nr:hypothetical protein [Pyrinomonadaceae bacterium]
MSKKSPVVMFLMICLLAASSVVGQKKLKPWTEWSKEDAQKILKDSPWAHQQVDQDFIEANALRPRAINSEADARLKQNEGMTYSIRFFSARPVRRAFVRIMQLQKKDLAPDMVARLNTFAEAPSEDSIIVAVAVENPDANLLGKAMQIIRNATAVKLKNTTYLERTDGKRVYIEEYTPPGGDGFGARFIFPRMLDGKPFLDADSTMIRFVSELDSSIKLNMKYKVKEMMLDDKIEY